MQLGAFSMDTFPSDFHKESPLEILKCSPLQVLDDVPKCVPVWQSPKLVIQSAKMMTRTNWWIIYKSISYWNWRLFVAQHILDDHRKGFQWIVFLVGSNFANKTSPFKNISHHISPKRFRCGNPPLVDFVYVFSYGNRFSTSSEGS